jgi:hypothetical protein
LLPIFLGTIVLAIYQALPSQRERTALDSMAPPYVVALVANTLTPLVWLGLSNIVVLVLFALLVAAYAAFADPEDDLSSSLCVRLPLAMFATWAGLATVVYACQLLVSWGVPIEPVTASLLYIVATLVGCWALWRTGEIVIAAALTWAGAGIVAAHSSEGMLLLAIAAATLGIVVVAWFRRRRFMTKAGMVVP